MPGHKALATAVLKTYGQSFCDELGIDLASNRPSPLYCWLVAATLFSARISAPIAAKAAKALFDAGLETPAAMAGTEWEERTRILNHAGYARYDESTARMLGDGAQLLLSKYDGDLGALRAAAAGDMEAARQMLKQFKGIGDVGADIFMREVQLVWEEFYPFADKKALRAAKELGLPDSTQGLALVVARKDFVALLAGLVRLDLAGDYAGVRARA